MCGNHGEDAFGIRRGPAGVVREVAHPCPGPCLPPGPPFLVPHAGLGQCRAPGRCPDGLNTASLAGNVHLNTVSHSTRRENTRQERQSQPMAPVDLGVFALWEHFPGFPLPAVPPTARGPLLSTAVGNTSPGRHKADRVHRQYWFHSPSGTIDILIV